MPSTNAQGRETSSLKVSADIAKLHSSLVIEDDDEKISLQVEDLDTLIKASKWKLFCLDGTLKDARGEKIVVESLQAVAELEEDIGAFSSFERMSTDVNDLIRGTCMQGAVPRPSV